MTLVLVAGNADYVVFLADRRLASGGKPIDEEAGKTGILHCGNARLGFAFAGLASANGFDTHRWLLSTLGDLGVRTFDVRAVLHELTTRLTGQWASKQMAFVSRLHKRLSIAFGGYLYPSSGPP